jgi:hypothetical protein
VNRLNLHAVDAGQDYSSDGGWRPQAWATGPAREPLSGAFRPRGFHGGEEKGGQAKDCRRR